MANKKTFIQQENMYWQYRQDATSVILPQIIQAFGIDVAMSDINQNALDQATKWRNHYVASLTNNKPGWKWLLEMDKYRKRPRRIELAIWVDAQLCGLMIGRVSDRRAVVSIHLIESNPHSNPLRGGIALIGTRWLMAFGGIIGCKEIAVDKPLPGLILFYKELGYTEVVSRGRKVIRMKVTL